MVSIITPTYNRSALLKRAARSVLAQTYSDWEWIILDDGSGDDTAEMVKGFDDARIRYVFVPHVGRLPVLRNKALSLAKGEFIAFLDSDDEWKPRMLENALRILENAGDLGFVLADAEIVENGRILYPRIYKEEHKRSENFLMPLFTDNLFVIFPSTLVMRKEVPAACGYFDEQLKFGDKDMFTRMAFHFKGRISNEVSVVIHRHGGNESSSEKLGSLAEGSFKEELYTLGRFLGKGYIEQKFHDKWSGIYFSKLAEFYYRNGHFKEANEAYRSSLRYRPGNAKGIYKYFSSKLKARE